MRDGRIVDHGTHRTLAGRSVAYADLLMAGNDRGRDPQDESTEAAGVARR